MKERARRQQLKKDRLGTHKNFYRRITDYHRTGPEDIGPLAPQAQLSVVRRDGKEFKVPKPGETVEAGLREHIQRVSTALALISTEDDNPLSADKWSPREAYLIQICASMPWIRDGEAAKLVGRSIQWTKRLRQHPDFQLAVRQLISIVSRAMGVQMEVLQHRSFDILRERLDSDDEDKRYEAAMAVLRGTGVLVPKSDNRLEVEHKLSGFDDDAVAKLRYMILQKQREDQKKLEAENVIEGEATEVD